MREGTGYKVQFVIDSAYRYSVTFVTEKLLILQCGLQSLTLMLVVEYYVLNYTFVTEKP